jgi:hypothetical protein
MNKKLTDDQSKIDLVARLVKDGSIDFSEAIKLLETEVETEYVYPTYPLSYPTYPVYPDWWNKPYWGINTNGTVCEVQSAAVTDFIVSADNYKGTPFTYTTN